MLSLIHRLTFLAIPLAGKVLVDEVVRTPRADRVAWSCGLLATGALLQAVSAYASHRVFVRLAQGAVADLRERLFEHVIRLPLARLDAQHPGVLASKVQHSLPGAPDAIARTFVDLVVLCCLAVGIAPVLLRIDAMLAAACLGVAMLWGARLALALGRSRSVFDRLGGLYQRLTGEMDEALAGVRVVKSAVAEDSELSRYRLHSHAMRDGSVATADLGARYALTGEISRGLAAAGLVYLGASRVAGGHLSPGSLVMFGSLAALAAAPVASIAAQLGELRRAVSVLDDARRLLETPIETGRPARMESEFDPRSARGALRFDDVWFEHEAGRPVLCGVSFEVAPGTIVGIVGPSGGGKTTLLELLMRFREPTRGRILLDGVDIASIDIHRYRGAVGLVGQEVFLFDRTIRENVAYGEPQASDDEVVAACERANANFVTGRPDGLNGLIGERGVSLSGGERQRLAIARAILPAPRMLLLDEATSSIDPASELAVQDAVFAERGRRTTLLVAHRLGAVRRADRILVIQCGSIVDQGTHAELSARPGLYRELFEQQVSPPLTRETFGAE